MTFCNCKEEFCRKAFEFQLALSKISIRSGVTNLMSKERIKFKKLLALASDLSSSIFSKNNINSSFCRIYFTALGRVKRLSHLQDSLLFRIVSWVTRFNKCAITLSFSYFIFYFLSSFLWRCWAHRQKLWRCSSTGAPPESVPIFLIKRFHPRKTFFKSWSKSIYLLIRLLI